MLESLSERRKGTGMYTNSKAGIVMAEEPPSNLVLSFQASKRKRYRVSFIILICQMGKKSLRRKSIFPYCFYGHHFIQFQTPLKSRGGCLFWVYVLYQRLLLNYNSDCRKSG